MAAALLRGTQAALRPATLGLTLAAVALPGPGMGQSYAFNDVSIEGLELIEPATVLSYAGIVRGQPMSAGALNAAYQRIQASGLFESVELVPSGNILIIRVQEYPTVNVIAFEGNRRLSDDVLAGVIRSQPRRVYSPAEAEGDAARIAQAYAESARYAARVEPRIIRRPGNRVDLAFEIREGAVTEVERISFTGNRNFSNRRLRQVIDTKQAGLLRTFIQRDSFVPDRVEFDRQLLVDFYRSRGYIDAEVQGVSSELSRERDAFFMTFSIREGQIFRFNQITTVSEVPGIDAAAFGEQNRIRAGTTYSPSAIENTISRMEALALRQGLNFVRIDPRIRRNDATQTLDVEFALVRGPRIFVERIDIEGNTTTLDQVVRRQFRTVEGDPFNPREIRNAAERIRALGFFADAQVQGRPGTADDLVIVDVDVEEQPTGSLGFGVSYGVNTGLGAAIQLQESNFLGRGQFVAVSVGTSSDTADTSLTFIEPFFLGRDLRFRFSGFLRSTDQDNSNYSTRLAGISPAIEFPVSENGRVEFRYSLSKDKLYDIRPIVDEEGTGSSPILQREASDLWSSSIGYSYSHDTRVTGLNPNAGVLFRFSQDYSGLGGDIESLRTTALVSAQRRVWQEEVLLRAELEGGVLKNFSDNSRVLERFSGNGRIRGFEPNGFGPRDLSAPNQDALGGDYFAALRLEAEFPLGLPEEYGISGGLFLDFGSVWGLSDTMGHTETVDDSMHIRSAIGFSVFWDTPIGPLRFNFAKALIKEDYDRSQSFDLTVSTRF